MITTETLTSRSRRLVPDAEHSILVMSTPHLSKGAQSQLSGLVLVFGNADMVLLNAFLNRPRQIARRFPFGHVVMRETEMMLVHTLRIGDEHFWFHDWYRWGLGQYVATRPDKFPSS